ncbi:IS630 family transposase [Candidatus Absconditicoccus praedator]|uniref:IS630 family transposase n=1 Tax=Candidatus Absconditicoccus praedator TaxID=2735562 RepID=UPI001E613BB2|nr:IS630 family transposase [Candidatus Absconditicoccus praedator]UFX83520.1 IS630 family transposase [Candidatus Absconditicoccus praedator]
MQEVIKKVFGKNLKEWKVREIAIEMGFTNQQPIFKAYQQNPEAVEKREKETLPQIKEEAKREGREIYYGDEAGFKSSNHKGKTRGKKGETPVVTSTGARFGVNGISVVSPKGEMRFMIYEGSFNSNKFIEFLKRFHEDRKKKTLILDGHPIHKTKKVNEYLNSINNEIKIYFIPGYSPELNPDEQVWNQVHSDLKGQVVRGNKHLMEKIRKSLYRLQKQKYKVMTFFNHPDIRRNLS